MKPVATPPRAAPVIAPTSRKAVQPTPAPKPVAPRPNNPNGNPGYHASTHGFEHNGPTHSSDDR